MMLLPPEFIENFHFLRPLLLLGLIPAIVLFLLLYFLQRGQSSWTRAIDPQLLPFLLDKSMSAKQSYPLYGLLLIWTLATVALAGPVWKELPVPVQEREDAVVIVADLTLSMYADDISPNRVTRLKRKIIDILEYRRQEGQTALVVYAGDAHTVTPMTDDVETISNLVPSLDPNIMPNPGSRPASGVRLATELLANSNIVSGRILLLTDGVENTEAAAIMEVLNGTGHTLSIIGFGTASGAPIPYGQQGFLRDSNNAIVIPRLEREPLQQLASRAGGLYTDAQLNDDDVEYVLREGLLDEAENLVDVEDREFDTWYEAGPWLLLLALPFAALAFRRGWIFCLVLAVGAGGGKPAMAWEWQDLWERKDQQGSEAFSEEEFEQAAEAFKDPEWRAAANYRTGNYEKVVQDLALIDDPEAHYNRGNALARLGMFEQAIEAYERTLAQAPEHEDARHNKELVEKLLEEQQQEQQQQQSEGDQQQDQQQQDQQNQQNQDQQNQDQNQQQQNQNQDQQQQNQDQQQQDQNEQNQDQQQEQEEQNEEDEEQQQQEQQQQELSESSQPESEEEQSMQQWLMRIPDDPGELLRNKFRYQYQQRLFEELQNPQSSQEEAGDKIW